MFLGQKPLVPIDVTAEWLFARTEMRRPRCWIHGKYFYVREKEDFPLGPIEKYRYLGKSFTSYTFRIVKVA
jgi:hypothetical protein